MDAKTQKIIMIAAAAAVGYWLYKNVIKKTPKVSNDPAKWSSQQIWSGNF